MKRFLQHFAAFSALVLVMGVSALPASAQQVLNTGTTQFGEQTALGDGGQGGLIGIISNIINIGLGFLGILTVLYLLYGGFTWMTAGGEVEKISKAKRILVQSVIGLTIILSSWGIAVFVLGAIGNATGANVDGTGGPGGGGPGGGFNGPGPDSFVVQGIAPAGNGQNRNVVVRVVLNKPVNPTSAEGNVQIAFAGQPVAGTVAVSGSTVDFTPSAQCPDPNGTLNCLDENATYTVTVSPNLRSTDDKPLTCGGLAPPCTANFQTGAIVDTQAPTGTLTGPFDGMNFNINDGFTFQSQSSDNIAISKVDYSADGVLAVSDAPGASLPQWTSTRNYKPLGATPGKVYNLTGKVFDTATNNANLSGSVNVVARAAHCFNGMTDQDESGPDCGGASCGTCTGGQCTVNTDCATGVCANGVCVAQPVIMDLQARDGAEGNYVTITGQNFGTGGTVTFLGTTADTDNRTANLACSGAWSDTQIIVAVPDGAVTGAISVLTGSGLIDTTSDTRGPQFSFTVNDVKRPGLCSLSPSIGRVAANVTAKGTAFGTAVSVLFGTLSSDLNTADEETVNFTVPSSPDGNYPVSIKVADQVSNTINFRVFTPPPTDPPFISSITPVQGPIGQYVTIQGSNFGTAGTVRFIQGSEFVLGDVTFPQICGNEFWRTSTVIVKVPANVSGAYKVVVNRSSGEPAISTNSVDFSVVSGTASPGVCRMDPTSGPASTPVKFYGDGFGASAGTVAFTGATASNPVEWGTSQALVSVPANATTGQVRVVSSGALQSNPTFFQVGSCQENPSMCGAGQQCCDNGSCSTTCSVELPQQTYAWRFSTGMIPQYPRLLTQCDMAEGSVIPSPSPLAARAGGNQVCTNAVISAMFDQNLDQTTVNGNTVHVWECADETCAAVTAKTGSVGPLGTTGLTFIPQSIWTATKTYLVEVSSGLKAASSGTVTGTNAPADPTCNRGTTTNTAYCWKFTAGATSCAVGSLALAPSEAAASEPYDVTRSNETSIPFQAQPGANPNLCLSLNGNSFGYTWDTSNVSIANILNAVSASARVAPLRETGASPVLVRATTQPPSGASITGTANLSILFARPKVVSYEPNCQDACVNSALRATFNTVMSVPTVDIQLMLCSDAECKAESRVGNLTTGLPVTASADKKTFSVSPSGLIRGSYYRALIPAESGGNCKGCSSAGISLAEQGSNFQIGNAKYFSWIFRTKNDAALCAVSSVIVEPVLGSVTGSGQGIVKYGATPRSTPDSCSPSGQALDPWIYDWTWALGAPNVAGEYFNRSSATPVRSGTLDAQGKYVSGISTNYTAQCLKLGADAALGVNAKCGNGAWEKTLGEACDDGNILDSDGCSKSCLIEPFTNQNVWTRGGTTGQCGDSNLQRNASTGVGEECDDGAAGSARCTVQCKATGVTAGVCGNGSIDPGENCDDGNAIGGDGCSATCLSQGSPSNVTVCGDGRVDPREECDNTSPANWDACNHQKCLWSGTTTSCGNSTIQLGETCDDGNAVAGDGCSSSCLLEGASAFYATPSFCGDGTVGMGEAAGSEASITRTLTDPIQHVRRIANPIAPFGTQISATTRGVTGNATYEVCTAPDGVCTKVVPELVAQCGSNQTPAGVPSPAPLVNASDSTSAMNGNVCTNAVVSGIFNVAMDATSLTKQIALWDCGEGATLGGDCNAAGNGEIDITSEITVDNNDKAFHVAHAWDKDRVYMVGVPIAVVSALGVNPVADAIIQGTGCDQFGDKLHACWQFKVGTTECAPSAVSVSLSPNPSTQLAENVTGTASVLSDSCVEISNAGYTFEWNSSDEDIADFPVDLTTAETTLVSAANGETTVSAKINQAPLVIGLNTLKVDIGAENCPAGQGQDDQGNCANRPKVESTDPADGDGQGATGVNDLGVPRNALVTVMFDQPMLESSLAGGFKVEYEGACGGSGIVPPANPSTITTWCATKVAGTVTTIKDDELNVVGIQLQPTQFLPSLKWHRIVVAKTVQSKSGVTLTDSAGSDFRSYFLTASRIAPLVGVRIEDSELTTPGVFSDPQKPARPMMAFAFGQTSSTGRQFKIFPVPNEYAWDWGTGSGDTKISGWSPETAADNSQFFTALAKQSSEPPISPSIATVTVVKPTELSDGGVIAATATIVARNPALSNSDFFTVLRSAITIGDQRSGTFPITVFPCANPWPSAANFPWTDTYSDLSIYYCRDGQGSTLLPDLQVSEVMNRPSGSLKEYLFTTVPLASAGSESVRIAAAGDVIGLRVLPNPLHLPVLDWYKSRGFTGNPQAVTVDGYDALLDGRTLYVAGANAAGTAIYTNIYVISYNLGTGEDILTIFNQFRRNMRLNASMHGRPDNINLCRLDVPQTSGLLFDNGQLIGCDADDVCAAKRTVAAPTAACSSVKAKLRRDVKRTTDFRAMSQAIGAAFQQVSAVPSLASGSFLRSFSTSIWPSWGNELAESVGAEALPQDPKNSVLACQKLCSNDQARNCITNSDCTTGGTCEAVAGYEETTCWNETKQQFACSANSHVYSYRGIGSTTAGMGIAFEAPTFTTMLGAIGVCENGSPNAGEPCDVGVSPAQVCGLKPNQTTQFYACVNVFGAASVQAPLVLDPAGVCKAPIGASARCGDGVVSASEICEVGQIGSPASCASGPGTRSATCNATCSGYDLGACIASACGDGSVNASTEACDDGSNNGKYGYCNSACTCKNGIGLNGVACTTSAFCGDSVVGPGEQCDEGTANGRYRTAAGVGCSATCTFGAPRCGDAVKQPQETCELGETKVEENTCGTGLINGRVQIKKFTCSSCQWDAGSCVAKGSCGDGVKDTGELCDDGNTNNGDSCTNQCTFNVCGDGNINGGVEECDDGDRNGSACQAPYGGVCNFCSSICKLRTVSGGICGNSKQEIGEKCDGNDYGGKVCVGGETPNEICGTDADCGAGGSCSAQFCLQGLHCTVYGNLSSPNAPWTGPVLRDWFSPNVDYRDNWSGSYCSLTPSKKCNGAGDCTGSGNTCVATTSPYILQNATNHDNFSVRCEGYLTPKKSEVYTLRMVNDDNGRVYLDGAKLIDAWVAQDASSASSGSIALQAGKRYPIRIEHLEWGGGQQLRLTWQSASQAEEIIPATSFSYAPIRSGSTLSCNLGAGTWATQTASGVCLGGSIKVDGASCATNAECGGTGICSFVPGTCFDPTDRSTGAVCRSRADCAAEGSGNIECGAGICNGGRDNGKICAATSQCADNSPCIFSKCNLACSAFCPVEFQPVSLSFKTIDQTSKCTAGHKNNVGGLCGQDSDCNKAACSPNSPDCVGGTSCVSGKCQYPANFNLSNCPGGYLTPDGRCAMCTPSSVSTNTANLGSFNANNATSVCTNRCKSDADPSVYGVACSTNTCSKRCVNSGGQMTNTCSSDTDCSSGYTCSVAKACVNGPRDALSCSTNSECSCATSWSCETGQSNMKCVGGPLDKLTCSNDANCRVLPDRAWLTIPQCRAIYGLTADLNMPVAPQNEDVYVAFITDVSGSMVAPSASQCWVPPAASGTCPCPSTHQCTPYGACELRTPAGKVRLDEYYEGSPYVTLDCDGDGNTNTEAQAATCPVAGQGDPDDTRMLCATNNLFGRSATKLNPNSYPVVWDRTAQVSGALDRLFEIDPSKMNVAMLNFSRRWGPSSSYDAEAYIPGMASASNGSNFSAALTNFITASQVQTAKSTIAKAYDSVTRGTGGDTGAALRYAKAMLDAKTGKKIVIVLTDAYNNESGHSGFFADAQAMKQANIDVYAISYAKTSQQWQLKSWSSDCPYSSRIPVTSTFAEMNSNTETQGLCMNYGYFNDALTAPSLSAIYDQIFGAIRATIQIGAPGVGAGIARTLSTSGFERPLDTTFLKCDPNAIQNIPFYLNYVPVQGSESQKASIGNVKAQYCPMNP